DDLMSSPARTVSPDETVARALVACQRYGQSGILVAEDDRLAGVVGREDLDRAVAHGLSHAPVKGIMSTRVATCDEETPLAELQRLLAAGEDRVAVVRGEQIVGVVTRSDLLRALGAPTIPAERAGPMLTDELAKLERLQPVFDAPAALPTVEHASIREDLFRRDFTINAMAVSLKGADLGRLVDPFGGRRDLEAKTIRVLHNLSFIDDPTRIFRAIRYENRYGFRMDEHTVRLARGTIEIGLVGDLSSARLRDELVALLEEGGVEHSILRLAELGADKAIHPHLAADDEAVKLLARLRALAQQYELDVPAWRLALIALARKLPPDEVYDWLQRLKMRRRDAEQIAAAVTVGPRIVERLRNRDVEPAETVALADRYAPDAPLFALALTELEPLHD